MNIETPSTLYDGHNLENLIVGTCHLLWVHAVHPVVNGYETYRSVTKSVGNRETFHVSDGRSIAVSLPRSARQGRYISLIGMI